MGKSRRDSSEIYAIYGMEEWPTLAFLLLFAALLSFLSILFLLHFSYFQSPLSRFAASFVGAVAALSAVCLLFAASSLFYCSGALRWEMAHRMIGAVPDWSGVSTVLDVGCGRGVLLNAVAKHLKKQGSWGRVVGVDHSRSVTISTLRTASIEGVQEYVTCREGDARELPFRDEHFDVVVSALFLHRVGREMGRMEAAAERARAVAEMVRVLKPGGVGVVWDVQHMPEYVTKLEELRMEEIRVSPSVTAFMMTSHVVSFRKPRGYASFCWRSDCLC